jgi:hypothetical protein
LPIRTVLWSIAGPSAFATAAFVGGRIEPGYSPRDEPISALAAHGTRSAPVMIPGFLGLGVASIALARELRGSALAPSPVVPMMVLAGLTVAGAGLARCSNRSCPTRMLGDPDVMRTDDLHAAFSAATFALWISIPLVAAQRGQSATPVARRASRVLGLTTLAALLAGGRMAQRPSTRGSGTAQRVMIASAFAWFPLAALAASKRPNRR